MTTELLQQYIIGNISEKDKKKVVLWISENEGNMKEYMSLRRLYDIELTLGPVPSSESDFISNRKTHRTKLLHWTAGIAAAVLLFFGGFLLSESIGTKDGIQELFVPAGQRSEVILADGTKVWLGSNSYLSYSTGFDSEHRSVNLNGEAFFSVTSDAQHPFIVKTDKYDIRVLGTEFNVTAYEGSNFWETALLKGKVELTSTDDPNEKYLLSPNTKIVQRGSIVTEERFDSEDYTEKKEGVFVIKNMSLSDILERIHLQKNVDFEIESPEKLNLFYTGKFRNDESVQHILSVLSVNDKFSYKIEKDGKRITIY